VSSVCVCVRIYVYLLVITITITIAIAIIITTTTTTTIAAASLIGALRADSTEVAGTHRTNEEFNVTPCVFHLSSDMQS
jgi:hypothetical protein